MKRFFKAIKWNIDNYGVRRGIIKFIIKSLQKIENKLDYKANRKIIIEKEKEQEIIKKRVHNEIDELIKNSKYKYIFLFYPYVEWNLPIFQRPQQIALSLTKNRDDVLYFFGTVNCFNDHIDRLEKVNDNLYLTTEFEYLTHITTDKIKVLHLYSTDTVSTLDEIYDMQKRGFKVLYEYIDEIHEDITQNISDDYLNKHNKILKDETIFVVTTADKLYNDVKNVRKKNYILNTNGVNVEDFIDVKDDYIPSIIKELKEKYSKIICYYGALAKWFDYKLLKECAKRYNSYCFLLIGVEYDDSYKASGIENIDNIKFIGKVNYTELVHYANKVDLLTIPFLVNDITESTSPVKLFEYMALQIPILTTNLRECLKYKSVNVAKSSEEYIEMIDKCITLSNNEEYKALELREANENSWNNKASQILDFINNEERSI